MSVKDHFFAVDFIGMLLVVVALESDSGVNIDGAESFTTFKFGLKPSDKKCHNFCSLMSELCRNGGSCVMDDDTCIATCVCASGWAGRWCRDEETLSEKTRVDNATKVTGPALITLDLNKIRNDIKGTAGSVTDDVMRVISKVRANNTKPFEFKTAKMINTGKVMNASSVKDISPKVKFSDDDTDTGVKETTFSSLTGVSKCLKTCAGGDCIAKDGQYVCTRRRDVTNMKGPKTCQPGFVCQNGVCDMETKDNGLKCICEPNYIGTFCDMKCPFDCGDHGVCDYHVDDNQMKCFCQWNYTGLNCTELIPLPPGLYCG